MRKKKKKLYNFEFRINIESEDKEYIRIIKNRKEIIKEKMIMGFDNYMQSIRERDIMFI